MNPIVISYIFSSDDDAEKKFELRFNPETMEYLPQEKSHHPDWTRLEHCQCKNMSHVKKAN